MFFKSDNNQFTTLRVLLHKLYKETKNIEEVKDGAEMNMVIKLNMKLIQLLQVIETIFISKPYIVMNNVFIDALVILMYLFEKLKILDFALPDRVNQNFLESSPEPQKVDEKSQQQQTQAFSASFSSSEVKSKKEVVKEDPKAAKVVL